MLSFPLATSPRVLTRLLEQVAAGHRRPRALGEALGVEPPVIRSYLLAGEWLGLLELGEEPALTADGLACVYAGTRRGQVLARVIDGHPVLAALRAPGEALTADDLARAIQDVDPTLGPRAVRRRALALKRLLAPGLRPPPRVAVPPPPEGPETEAVHAPEQLTLGFSSDAHARPDPLDLRAGADDNPDVYTHVLRALLDHGELDPHQLRGLLDTAGGSECGIGGYLAMATRRGDATRVGDVLVVTEGAIARRDLAESPVSVALSDPDFRRHVTELLAGRPGDSRRFRPWTNRLFRAGTVAENLERLLFGRSLASFPLAGDPGAPHVATSEPFLGVVERRGLAVAFPSSLTQLAGGVAVVNRQLRAAQQGQLARVPQMMDRRVRVHGGLLYPGEPAVRVVADQVSLRARVIKNVPALAILAALGLLDRRGALRLRQVGNEVVVTAGGRARTLDAVVETLAHARAWVVARSPTGTPWGTFAEVAEQLGLLVSVAPFLTMDEAFFRKLGTDPEHRDLLDGLDPLAAMLDARVGRP